jgi:hypothetical protein
MSCVSTDNQSLTRVGVFSEASMRLPHLASTLVAWHCHGSHCNMTATDDLPQSITLAR